MTGFLTDRVSSGVQTAHDTDNMSTEEASPPLTESSIPPKNKPQDNKIIENIASGALTRITCMLLMKLHHSLCISWSLHFY